MRQRGSKGKQGTHEKTEVVAEASSSSSSEESSTTGSSTPPQQQQSTTSTTTHRDTQDEVAYVRERKSIAASWPTSLRLWLVVLVFAALGFGTRFWDIHEPNETVFDEVYFGSFTTSYVERQYFFDIHPPLGKLVLAFAGSLKSLIGAFTLTFALLHSQALTLALTLTLTTSLSLSFSLSLTLAISFSFLFPLSLS